VVTDKNTLGALLNHFLDTQRSQVEKKFYPPDDRAD
jgi:hypothetical protein